MVRLNLICLLFVGRETVWRRVWCKRTHFRGISKVKKLEILLLRLKRRVGEMTHNIWMDSRCLRLRGNIRGHQKVPTHPDVSIL